MLTDAALNYMRLGFRPIRLAEGSKAAEIRWKEYQSRPPGEEEVRRMFASGSPNIGLVTGGGVVVVDVDDPAPFWMLSSSIVEKRRCRRSRRGEVGTSGIACERGCTGMQFGLTTERLICDVKGAYVVSPWSHHGERLVSMGRRSSASERAAGHSRVVVEGAKGHEEDSAYRAVARGNDHGSAGKCLGGDGRGCRGREQGPQRFLSGCLQNAASTSSGIRIAR